MGTDPVTDAARPARRRRAPPRRSTLQRQATESLFKGLDRFGLAPVLLLGLAYVGHTQVVVPIATAYANMVATVADTNKMLRQAIEQNNREDAERVAAISAAQVANRELAEANRELNQSILAAIARADEERRSIHAATKTVLERVEARLAGGLK